MQPSSRPAEPDVLKEGSALKQGSALKEGSALNEGSALHGSSADVVVVGGGLAGLVAARRLAQRGLAVTVLEASDRVGGKLRATDVAGCVVDSGAEAMLARRPEGLELARELGLPLVVPEPVSPQVWVRGELRPLPRTLMGAPVDSVSLRASGVLSAAGLERALAEDTTSDAAAHLGEAGDVSVGELIARRFGDEVVDLLVEPLLGGVYAGNARRISARAAVPQLLAALARGPLLDGTPTALSTGSAVFAGVRGGMWRIAESLAATPGVRVLTGRQVIRLGRGPAGFGLTLATDAGGGEAVEESLSADRVVLATPAQPSARLLGELAPEAARLLGGIESASVAVVTLALTPESVGELPGSGFLVPPVEPDLGIKAATFSANKWAWVDDLGRAADPGVVLLRTSWGRAGDSRSLQRSDAELIEASRADLSRVLGGRDLQVVAGQVQRWDDGLPQYAVGHLERVAQVRADVARVPGLAVCGAAYDGVGIPAVIASAEAAVAVLTGTVLMGPVLMGPVLTGTVLMGPVLTGTVLTGTILPGRMEP